MENFRATCFFNVTSLFMMCIWAKGNPMLELFFWTVAIVLNILHFWAAYKAMDNHQFNQYAAFLLVFLVAFTWITGGGSKKDIRYLHIAWSIFNYFVVKGFWYSWKHKEEWERTKNSDNKKIKDFLDSISRVRNPYNK